MKQIFEEYRTLVLHRSNSFFLFCGCRNRVPINPLLANLCFANRNYVPAAELRALLRSKIAVAKLRFAAEFRCKAKLCKPPKGGKASIALQGRRAAELRSATRWLPEHSSGKPEGEPIPTEPLAATQLRLATPQRDSTAESRLITNPEGVADYPSSARLIKSPAKRGLDLTAESRLINRNEVSADSTTEGRLIKSPAKRGLDSTAESRLITNPEGVVQSTGRSSGLINWVACDLLQSTAESRLITNPEGVVQSTATFGRGLLAKSIRFGHSTPYARLITASFGNSSFTRVRGLITNSSRIGHSKTGVKWDKNCWIGAAPVVGFRMSTRTELLQNSLKYKYEQSRPFGQNLRVPKVTMRQVERRIDVTPTFSAAKQNKHQGLPFNEFLLRKIAATDSAVAKLRFAAAFERCRLPSSGVQSSRSNQKILLCEFAALRSTASSSNTFKTKIWLMPILRSGCRGLLCNPKKSFGCSASLSNGRWGKKCPEVKTYLNSRHTVAAQFLSEGRCSAKLSNGCRPMLCNPYTPEEGTKPRATLSFFLSPLLLGPYSKHFCYAKVRTFPSTALLQSFAPQLRFRATALSCVAAKCSSKCVPRLLRFIGTRFRQPTGCRALLCSPSARRVAEQSSAAAPEFRTHSKVVLSECSCLLNKSDAGVKEKPKCRRRLTVWGVGLDTKYCRTKLFGSRKSALSTLFGESKRRFAPSSRALCNKSKTKYKTIRPLLNLSRESLTILCNNLRLPVYPDKSNKAVQYSRNRLREQILPAIKLFLNPKVDDALFKLAELLTQDFSLVSNLRNTGRRSTSLLALNLPFRGVRIAEHSSAAERETA